MPIYTWQEWDDEKIVSCISTRFISNNFCCKEYYTNIAVAIDHVHMTTNIVEIGGSGAKNI